MQLPESDEDSPTENSNGSATSSHAPTHQTSIPEPNLAFLSTSRSLPRLNMSKGE